jgi:alkanesulfonate monooxygenase SsuD/methylene tetrahydromethanopterin reductase-like flavin-dependent oxidoreductase (luciferase family)
MLELAGEVGDGVMLHPFSNRAYDDAVVRPQLELGLATGGRTLSQLDVSRSLFMVMADNDEQLEERRREASEKIAFYASTRSYAAVLEAVGFGDLQPELARLAKAKRWTEMATLVDGEVLEYFAVVGTPEQMPSMVREHLSPYVTRVSSYLGWPVDDSDRLRAILAEFDRPAPVA